MLLIATHLGAFIYFKTRDRPEEAVFAHSVSLARLGFLGPDVYTPPSALHFLWPHLTSVFVNTSAVQTACNVAGAAWFGANTLRGTVAHPLRALVAVYGLSGLAGAGYARDEHVRALQGYVAMVDPTGWDAAAGGGAAAVASLLAAHAHDNADSRLVAYYPVYGALPATLGLAAFTALDRARAAPMYAGGVLPLLATALWLATMDAPDVPPVLQAANAAMGATTLGANAAGVLAGAACWAGHRGLRAAGRAWAAAAAARRRGA